MIGMAAPMVSIEHVNKVFYIKKHKIEALRDINMQFGKGEFVSIVGPSGCGKSTVIRLIDDLIKPTEGSITVDGVPYNNQKGISRDMVQKLGFIFQVPNLYPSAIPHQPPSSQTPGGT